MHESPGDDRRTLPAFRLSVPVLARRLPFTLLAVTAILVVTAATGTMMRPIAAHQLQLWGFGLDDLRSARLYPLLLTPWQAYRPYMVVTITASLLLFLGACEYVLGTRRAFLAFWATHLAGYLGAFLLLWPLVAGGVGWAERLTRERDVGASAAAFGVIGAVVPFLPPTGRRLALGGLSIYLVAFLLVDQRIWDIEHIIAFLCGLALGTVWERQRSGAWPSLVAWPRFSHRQRPAVIAWAVAVMGVVNILSAFLSHQHRALRWLEETLPLGLTHAGRTLTLLLGFALIILSLGLARGKRQAWLLTVAALAASTLLHLTKGLDLREALLALGLLLLLVRWRDAFVARSDPASLRQGVGALAALAAVLPLYGVIGFFVLREQFTEVYSLAGALRETGARLLFLNAGEYAPETRRAHWFLSSIPILGWAGLLYALVMLLRGALAPKPATSDLDQARALLTAFGRSGTSYMTLWPGNAVFFGPGRAAYIGYRYAAGVALALGDPIGPDDALEPTVAAFDRFCREQGWDHAFYAATRHALAVYERLGYRALKIGEEALIPLPALELKGKAWQDVRTAMNRAAREGITFRLYEGGEVPDAIRQQLFGISAAWLKAKGLPEMGFTLGTTDDVDDPNVYVAVAVDATGRVHGFVDWLPMYAARGWVLDLMRRAPEAFAGVMEFLIGSSLLAFKERGDRVASLAAAPLADLDRRDTDSTLAKALGFIYEHADAFYQFASLFAFKKKFQPRWEGVYLVYRNHTELPRIALAILRAYMPKLGLGTLADLVGASVAERRPGRRSQPAAAGNGSQTVP